VEAVRAISASCYELLGVPVDAPRTVLARAWRKRRDDVLGLQALQPGADSTELLERIDEAFRILADPERARRYRAYRADLARGGRRLAEPADFEPAGPESRAGEAAPAPGTGPVTAPVRRPGMAAASPAAEEPGIPLIRGMRGQAPPWER
jgi:curved DNA-binding protein CbpA